MDARREPSPEVYHTGRSAAPCRRWRRTPTARGIAAKTPRSSRPGPSAPRRPARQSRSLVVLAGRVVRVPRQDLDEPAHQVLVRLRLFRFGAARRVHVPPRPRRTGIRTGRRRRSATPDRNLLEVHLAVGTVLHPPLANPPLRVRCCPGRKRPDAAGTALCTASAPGAGRRCRPRAAAPPPTATHRCERAAAAHRARAGRRLPARRPAAGCRSLRVARRARRLQPRLPCAGRWWCGGVPLVRNSRGAHSGPAGPSTSA